MKKLIATLSILFISFGAFAQFPWERPLKMAWSADGITFGTPAIYQDSSGVPSVIRWKGDTLICAFQWFRLPQNSPSWDKVAVKFSYDNGLTWTQPAPIIINGMPPSYQRPFDPTLVTFGSDSLRIFFSSSDGMPQMGLDSTVNTYSAKSTDGIHYYFEPNARVDELNNRVIDPAVIYFNNSWHYTAPIGSPQQGAYHFVSPDGLTFAPVPSIPSDNMHNWTGNMMIDTANELRFYGASPNFIWYNATANGGVWNGYVNTNIHGGDPSVVKIAPGNYLMIYVGEPYAPAALNEINESVDVRFYPNPVTDILTVKCKNLSSDNSIIYIYDITGVLLSELKIKGVTAAVDMKGFAEGIYIIKYVNGKNTVNSKIYKR